MAKRVERAFLTQPELKRLFKMINTRRNEAIFLTTYRHGLRASEIGLLKRTDPDYKLGRIRITRLKGSNGGVYPMQPDLIKLLRSYERERQDDWPWLFPSNFGVPIGRTMLHELMRKYGQLAKLPREKQHFHVLKHSIVTHLYEAGAPDNFVQDWVGHQNIQNTIKYKQNVATIREARAPQFFMSRQVV